MEKAAKTKKSGSKVYSQEWWKGNVKVFKGKILYSSCLEGNKTKEGEDNMP